MEAVEALAALFRDYGPWAVTAVSLLANAYLYRQLEALHQGHIQRIEALYADRLKAAETIIAAQTTSTAAAAAAIANLTQTVERVRSEALLMRPGGGGGR